MPVNSTRSDKPEDYINYLEPVTNFFGKKYANASWTTPRTHAIIILIISVLTTAGIFVAQQFVALPNIEWIYTIVGLILGFLLFVSTYYASILYVKEKKQANPEYLSLKERMSPSKRWRNGIFVFIVLLIGSAVLLSSLPSIAGGVLALASFLNLYAFAQRTPEEYEMFIEGEVDPRDLEDMADNYEYEEVETESNDSYLDNPTPEKLRKLAEYQEIVEKLPEEQREILMNDAKAINAFINHDSEDKKTNRKRKR